MQIAKAVVTVGYAWMQPIPAGQQPGGAEPGTLKVEEGALVCHSLQGLPRQKELWRKQATKESDTSSSSSIYGIHAIAVLDCMEVCRGACQQVAEFQKAALVKSYLR